MLKEFGIDQVYVVCINDGAVMRAWAVDQGVGADGEGSMITMFGDPHGRLIDALGLRMDHPEPHEKFGCGRTKRFSAYFEDGVLKILNVAEAPDDPAGDDGPENALVEKMIEDMKQMGVKDMPKPTPPPPPAFDINALKANMAACGS